MDQYSYLANSEPAAIEEMYAQYKQNPDSVDASWQQFFKGFDFATAHFPEKMEGEKSLSEIDEKEFFVINLIQAYRQRGHLFTKTNPVRKRRKYFPTLDIENFGLEKSDLDTVFKAGSSIGIGAVSLRKIIEHLETTYCGSVGVEYLYMRHPDVVKWLQNRMESSQNKKIFTVAQKKAIYQELQQAVLFEQFIHKKFVGEKRFSLEGSEVLIPGIWAICIQGYDLGVREYSLGMAHRGRLNVLANIMDKPYENIFREFEGGDYEGKINLGDVKYHLGYGRDIGLASGRKARLNLLPNPSHLETVLPVTEGVCRAKIDTQHDGDFDRCVPIVVHGDAAISGQGVVYETVQMSQLKGYKTGGTIHLVINNQIGFTTSYTEGRSSTYCTDIAKVTRSPVFHVNGDDVEAMVYTAQLAMEFRQKYKTDVFIDILSYRKYGHNEGDEPRFTQPTLYKAIANHPDPKMVYANKLLAEGVVTQAELDALDAGFNECLEGHLERSKLSNTLKIRQFLPKTWEGFKYPVYSDFFKKINTGVSVDKLKEIGSQIFMLPNDMPFFSKARKIMHNRTVMLSENSLDWGTAELLTYASLVEQGYSVRLSGQDAVRGTFGHRHAEFTYEDSEERYKIFNNLKNEDSGFEVYNSPLSEYGVLGFEYGYATAAPKKLTMWEAQFGDFHNVAQVIIDQYISSGEEKWGLMNGLVMLLPHGYEGQGPEHSSARIERFLSLAANNNMQIMNITTPSNFFHAMRRQMLRDFRVPMIIFTPKSLLRHPRCVSSLNEMQDDTFKEVIDDENVIAENVKRVVFTSGKLYYELLDKKEEFDAKDIALVRVEQYHPFPKAQIKEIVSKYSKAILHRWVQEEPDNMGAGKYIRRHFRAIAPILPVARLASGSPATGLKELHKSGQEEIIGKVFRKCTCGKSTTYCGLQCVDGASRKEVLKQHYYLKDQARFSI